MTRASQRGFGACVSAWIGALGLAGASMAEEHAISQADKQFSQSEITIKAGDTILFKNEDSVAHNLFSRSDGYEFNLQKQDPGAADSIPFAKPGSAEVRCAIHPKMKLVVTIEP